MRYRVVLMVLLLVSASAAAQQSSNYKMDEHALNAGGSPDGGVTLGSPGFSITLSSLGDGLLAATPASLSFQVQGGFVGGHPPAGEVRNLVFTDEVNLQWDPALSAGTYNVYRDLTSNLGALGYGNCTQPDLAGASAQDADALPLGQAYFYLVTVDDMLLQEGSKGFQSGGTERLGTHCP